MAERTAIEVTVDDAGTVTVHLRELSDSVRTAALTALARALGADTEGLETPTADWRRAWDAELARRLSRIDRGEATWVSHEDARERLRAAADRPR